MIPLFLLSIALSTDAEDWQSAQAQRIALIEKVSPSVLAVYGSGASAAANGGSGVIISEDGLAVTNFHVVQAAGGPFYQCGSGDGKLHQAVILGIDPVGDVALLQLLGEGPFSASPLGDSDQLHIGETVLAMGNPFLLSNDFTPTITMGIVSGLHRYQYPAGTILEYTDCIQTDAAVNPGNSGGPLFNCAGEVIGINGRISLEKRGRVNVGAAYAISINQIKNFLDHLRGGLIVDHAALGAVVVANREGRIVVDRIAEDSEAYRRGLRRGDEILSFADRPIRSPNELKNYLGIYPKGWRLPLTYRQDGERKTMTPRLLGVHGESGPLPAAESPTPPPVVPQSLREHFVAAPGFANYAANQKERDGVLQAFQGSRIQAAGTWKLWATSDAGLKVEVTLADQGAKWLAGDMEYAITREETGELVPPGSGGLLFALGQWRRFHRDPSAEFRSCDYAGGFPGPKGDVCPTLVTREDGVRTEWLFERDSGKLIAMEAQVAVNDDPCEIRFLEHRQMDGHPMPSMVEVWHRGALFERFRIEKVELSR